jgi:hypothetical protein
LHYGTSESLKCKSYLLTTFSYRLSCTAKGDVSGAIRCGIRTLSSVYFTPRTCIGEQRAALEAKVDRSQRSNTASYCTAYVPFGSARQTVGEGREKVRLTFQRFASPIVQLFCSLFVVTTFFRTNFRFPSPTDGVREVLFRECMCAH